jgi:hypothetical protein
MYRIVDYFSHLPPSFSAPHAWNMLCHGNTHINIQSHPSAKRLPCTVDEQDAGRRKMEHAKNLAAELNQVKCGQTQSIWLGELGFGLGIAGW